MDGDQNGDLDDGVSRHRNGIGAELQPVVDRIYELVPAACLDAAVALSYAMPTYQIRRRGINLERWEHGISLHVSPGRDGGFSVRHDRVREVARRVVMLAGYAEPTAEREP